MIKKITEHTYETNVGLVVLREGTYDAEDINSVSLKIIEILNDANNNKDDPDSHHYVIDEL